MIRSIPLSPSESSAPIHPHYSPYPESYKRIRGILAYQIGKRTQPLPQRQVVVVQIQTYHQSTKACWTGIATTPPPTYLSSKKMMLVDNRHSKSSIYDKRKTKKKKSRFEIHILFKILDLCYSDLHLNSTITSILKVISAPPQSYSKPVTHQIPIELKRGR
jgi:hypothetical protein